MSDKHQNDPSEIKLLAPEVMCESDSSQVKAPLDIHVITIVKYLAGQKDAILALAAYPQLLPLAAVFVLSAGFAREYDGEDLLHEPWHVLIPHAASIVTSVLLYLLVRLPAVRSRRMFGQFIAGYPLFLGLFWMTAPMAWIYAIPFERWLSEGGATRANLWLLGIVSVWRVVLMIRVIEVIYDVKETWRSVVAVLFFGDAVMLTAIHFLPTPVLQVMGGIRLSESEQILMMTKLLLQFIGFPTLVVLFIFYLFALPVTRGFDELLSSRNAIVRSDVWLLAIASILIWVAILPITQPALALSRQVEQALREGKISEALTLMSEHERTDFPAHWSPAPQIALPSETLPITDVFEAVLKQQAKIAPWVRSLYLEKFTNASSGVFQFHHPPRDDMVPYIEIFAQLFDQDWYDIQNQLPADVRSRVLQLERDDDTNFSEDTLQQLRRIVELVNTEE